uniref:Uncharacterized 12.7 kDa protein in 16S-23S DNA spacer n=1 Tax=Auxenochlorella pyrenoidosa TaxID=3078 RepID=YCX1_AUXPY|nr:RecName: Full=Uncharacterized 12.7 kDa protein in 16S-23S DNA spacer [Auxenochlorella pyrenoidosa]CAA27477.1 hypothetical protein [Chloroidium ellipsoideum]
MALSNILLFKIEFYIFSSLLMIKKKLVFSILKLLQLTEKDSKILVNESLTNKNFSKLIEFLDNYKVEKAKSITLQQLQSVLQNIKLNNSQKSEIIENIYSKLDAANHLIF